MEAQNNHARGTSLAAKISADLRRDLTEGVFQPGDRLPSESALTREYSVSRTV
ncbi:MAG: GntR family transcriptional regulator, partial [Ensifer adhaerens]